MLAALLALGSSALWGTADFLGGTVSRRLPVFTVMLVSQAVALATLVVVVPVSGGLLAPGRYLGWGVGYGLVGLLALAAFYRALATGTMGVVAPIAATGVVIPVLVGLADGDTPAAHQFAGMALAAAGIVLASMQVVGAPAGSSPDGVAGPPPWQAIALALASAAGFGTVFVMIERGSRTSIGMTLLAGRGASVLLLLTIALATRRQLGDWRPAVWPLAAVGVCDMSANAAFAFAGNRGALSTVAVLGSLYPVMTVLLARYAHGERLSRLQAAGVTAALLGVALIAATP